MGDWAASYRPNSAPYAESSLEHGPLDSFQRDFISVSTAFNPSTRFPYPYTNIPPESVLQTSDRIVFYIHREKLQSKSCTAFGGLFTDNGAVRLTGSLIVFIVAEDAIVINCVLLVLYGMSSRIFCPNLQTIRKTFSALTKYGCRLSECIPTDSEIFVDLVSHAADPNTDPLEVYALAASHGFEELAVQCSYHTLRIPVSSIDEPNSITMGPSYLLRLSRLHESRKAALRELLLKPATLHEDTPFCGRSMKINLMQAYGVIAGHLVWEAGADASPEWINGSFEMLVQSVGCEHCQHGIRTRVRSLISAWNEVKKTI